MPARADGHQATRRLLAAILAGAALGIALAGCGGGHGTAARRSGSDTATPNAPSTPSSRHGPVIVTFKRAIGVDPESSYFTLYGNGTGVATVVYGGIDGARVHHFTLRERQLRRVKRLLQHTRLPNQLARNTNLYIYWVITRNGAHRLQQGTVPRSARPLLGALNAIAAANHLF
jgi:hypothetical protein